MRINVTPKRHRLIMTTLCVALGIGIMTTLGNLHTSRPKHVQQLTWYAEGVPEQPPVLLVNGRVDDQLSLQRWQNSKGLRTHSTLGNGSPFSIVKPSFKHRSLILFLTLRSTCYLAGTSLQGSIDGTHYRRRKSCLLWEHVSVPISIAGLSG